MHDHVPWRGNVRELKARAERFALGLDEPADHCEEVPAPVDATLPERLAVYEAYLIREALERYDGSTAKAAIHLGIPHRTLNEKIARFGLRTSAEKRSAP